MRPVLETERFTGRTVKAVAGYVYLKQAGFLAHMFVKRLHSVN